MRDAASNLEFEQAARLRDEIKRLEAMDLGLPPPPMPSAPMRPAVAARRSRWGRVAAGTIRTSGRAARDVGRSDARVRNATGSISRPLVMAGEDG